MDVERDCLIPDWPAPPGVRALMTTRSGGISPAPFDSLNLGRQVGDDPANVEQNRRLLGAMLPRTPVWLSQVHGSKVISADRYVSGGLAPEGDAAMTAAHNLPCAVMVADCLPVFLCDESASVVGIAHAGWRGLHAGVAEATVQAMAVPPSSMMAWLGPAIGPSAFEVGPEVREAFVRHDSRAADAFTERGPAHPGKYFADIFLLARQRLAAAGVTRVFGGSHCTFGDPATFYSYRRDGKTGRMAGIIWLSK